MGLFRRRGSKANLVEEDGPAASGNPPPPPVAPTSPPRDILLAPNTVVCSILEPWQWLLEEAWQENVDYSVVADVTELPSSLLGDAKTDDTAVPAATPSRRRRKKAPLPCPLRVEIKGEGGRLLRASHATSEAFDGLEDKDELFRTLQRCRCDHLELSPPSLLLSWDVSKDECRNLVGKSLPVLSGTTEAKEVFAVLKEPMGSRGTGIFFVRNDEEIYEIIAEHKKRLSNSLDDLIASKGRVPSWVLQAEIRPCLLIRDRRKFHIRSYVVGVERWETEDFVDTFLYRKHEVRIAGESVSVEQNDKRDNKIAHVTNRAQEIELLDNVPELRDLQDRLEIFIAQIFAKHLLKDISHRVASSAHEEPNSPAVKFVVAGLDIMVTENKRLYLLEVNVNPIIPPPDTLSNDVKLHFVAFMKDLVDVVVGNRPMQFVSSRAIVSNHKP